MKTGIKIVNEQDRNRGLISAAVFGVVMMILLLFLSVTEPDPPLRDIPVPIELSAEMIMTPTSSSGASGGAQKSGSDNPKPTPPDSGDPVVTSKTPKEVKHNSGQGGSTTVSNPNPPQQQPDPTFTFGSGGQNGTGGSGNGPSFGQGTGDPGPGTGGNGNESGAGMSVVSKPRCCSDCIENEGKIVLALEIDDQGTVIRASNIASKSTTTSIATINEAIRCVKSTLRFNASPGAGTRKTEYTLNLKAN